MTTYEERRRRSRYYTEETSRIAERPGQFWFGLLFLLAGLLTIICWWSTSVPQPMRVALWLPPNASIAPVEIRELETPWRTVRIQGFDRVSAQVVQKTNDLSAFQQVAGNKRVFITYWEGWDYGYVPISDLPGWDVVNYFVDTGAGKVLYHTVPLPHYTFWNYESQIAVDRDQLIFSFSSDGERPYLWLVVAVVITFFGACLLLNVAVGDD